MIPLLSVLCALGVVAAQDEPAWVEPALIGDALECQMAIDDPAEVLEALESPNYRTRLAAIRALPSAGIPVEALTALADASESADPDLRVAAAYSAWSIASESVDPDIWRELHAGCPSLATRFAEIRDSNLRDSEVQRLAALVASSCGASSETGADVDETAEESSSE